MPKKQTNHVHKLKKHKYATGNSIYFCTLPDCYFKIDSVLALGKKVLCNICDSEFYMTEQSLKLMRPHCNDCGKVRVKDEDGNNRFVKKAANKALVGVALDSTKSLRDRLDAVSVDETDNDI